MPEWRPRATLALKRLGSLLALAGLALLPPAAAAEALVLPAEVMADARIDQRERDGLWEKTLIVRFPEVRRALSTSDGLVDS